MDAVDGGDVPRASTDALLDGVPALGGQRPRRGGGGGGGGAFACCCAKPAREADSGASAGSAGSGAKAAEESAMLGAPQAAGCVLPVLPF